MKINSISRKRLNLILLVLVLIDTILLFISSFSTPSHNIVIHIFYFDLFVCALLWIEFIHDLYYAESRKEYFKKNWYYIIAMIPLDFFFLRAVRFAGIIRLFGLTRTLLLFSRGRESYRQFTKTTHLDKLVIAILVFIIISTVTLFMIEPTSFGSLFDTFWYVIVTLTSVGYGDVVPETQNGKILAFVIIIVGIIFFSVFTAAVASIYIKKVNESNEVNYEKRLNQLKVQIDEIANQLERMNKDYQTQRAKELNQINEKVDDISKSIAEISKKIDEN